MMVQGLDFAVNLEQILAAISVNYPDSDIHHLVNEISAGRMHARKQLADIVSIQPARLSPAQHLEVARWGINDASSQCAEIRAQA